MSIITAEQLFEQIESYSPQKTGQGLSLRESEPYLFEKIEEHGEEIHGNDDYLIEELTDEDLDVPLHVA